MNIFELNKCNLRDVVMEIFDVEKLQIAEYYLENNIDPESEVGRIIQENEFAEGGKIDAKNYRIQELNVIRDLSCVKLEDKQPSPKIDNVR